MKISRVAIGFLTLAGCGLAPERFPLIDLETADRHFAPPPPADTQNVADEILRKEELSLEDVIAISDLMSPELASERANVDLATAAIWEARLYPNPSFLLQVGDYKTQSAFGSSKRMAGVSVPLVLGGRLGAATSQAEKEREVAAVNYVWRRREILADVKKAFLELLASRRNAELTGQTRDLAKALHDVTNERFKAQAIPEMELLKAAVALAKAESDLRLAEKDVAVSLKTLHARMGNVDFPKERFKGELAVKFTTPSLEALRGQVTTAHPFLEAAMKSKEAAELDRSRAETERIPDVGFEILAGQDGDHDTVVEGGFSIPIPLFNRNQAKIAAAEIRIRQAEFKIQAVRNELVLRLTESYKNFTAAQDRVTAYAEEILPKAQKALDQTNEGYKQGKFGYLDVLDAQRTLADARIAFAAALADLNLSAVELEKLTGTKLESIR